MPKKTKGRRKRGAGGKRRQRVQQADSSSEEDWETCPQGHDLEFYKSELDEEKMCDACHRIRIGEVCYFCDLCIGVSGSYTLCRRCYGCGPEADTESKEDYQKRIVEERLHIRKAMAEKERQRATRRHYPEYDSYKKSTRAGLDQVEREYYAQVKEDAVEESAELFKMLDTDRSGFIEQSELMYILTQIGMKEADVRVMFRLMDTNKDGKLDLKEFLSWVFKDKRQAGVYNLNQMYEAQQGRKMKGAFQVYKDVG